MVLFNITCEETQDSCECRREDLNYIGTAYIITDEHECVEYYTDSQGKEFVYLNGEYNDVTERHKRLEDSFPMADLYNSLCAALESIETTCCKLDKMMLCVRKMQEAGDEMGDSDTALAVESLADKGIDYLLELAGELDWVRQVL